MTFSQRFLGDKRPFWRTADGEEAPAVFVLGGNVALCVPGDEDTGLEYDPETNALAIIPWEHHQVHAGEMFHVDYTWQDLADGGNAQIRFRTGTKDAHVGISGSVGGKCFAYLYEDANISLGTELFIWNMDRNSAHRPDARAYHTPTVTNVGTKALVNGIVIPGGSGPAVARIGASTRTDAEWELKPNTEYLLRITNDSGGAIDVSMLIEFYERD